MELERKKYLQSYESFFLSFFELKFYIFLYSAINIPFNVNILYVYENWRLLFSFFHISVICLEDKYQNS